MDNEPMPEPGDNGPGALKAAMTAYEQLSRYIVRKEMSIPETLEEFREYKHTLLMWSKASKAKSEMKQEYDKLADTLDDGELHQKYLRLLRTGQQLETHHKGGESVCITARGDLFSFSKAPNPPAENPNEPNLFGLLDKNAADIKKATTIVVNHDTFVKSAIDYVIYLKSLKNAYRYGYSIHLQPENDENQAELVQYAINVVYFTMREVHLKPYAPSEMSFDVSREIFDSVKLDPIHGQLLSDEFIGEENDHGVIRFKYVGSMLDLVDEFDNHQKLNDEQMTYVANMHFDVLEEYETDAQEFKGDKTQWAIHVQEIEQRSKLSCNQFIETSLNSGQKAYLFSLNVRNYTYNPSELRFGPEELLEMTWERLYVLLYGTHHVERFDRDKVVYEDDKFHLDQNIWSSHMVALVDINPFRQGNVESLIRFKREEASYDRCKALVVRMMCPDETGPLFYFNFMNHVLNYVYVMIQRANTPSSDNRYFGLLNMDTNDWATSTKAIYSHPEFLYTTFRHAMFKSHGLWLNQLDIPESIWAEWAERKEQKEQPLRELMLYTIPKRYDAIIHFITNAATGLKRLHLTHAEESWVYDKILKDDRFTNGQFEFVFSIHRDTPAVLEDVLEQSAEMEAPASRKAQKMLESMSVNSTRRLFRAQDEAEASKLFVRTLLDKEQRISEAQEQMAKMETGSPAYVAMKDSIDRQRQTIQEATKRYRPHKKIDAFVNLELAYDIYMALLSVFVDTKTLSVTQTADKQVIGSAISALKGYAGYWYTTFSNRRTLLGLHETNKSLVGYVIEELNRDASHGDYLTHMHDLLEYVKLTTLGCFQYENMRIYNSTPDETIKVVHAYFEQFTTGPLEIIQRASQAGKHDYVHVRFIHRNFEVPFKEQQGMLKDDEQAEEGVDEDDRTVAASEQGGDEEDNLTDHTYKVLSGKLAPSLHLTTSFGCARYMKSA
jgi:hypothetical protein